jgi:hypothetical protein
MTDREILTAIAGGYLLFGAGVVTAMYAASAAIENRPGEMGYPRGWNEALAESLMMVFAVFAWPMGLVGLWVELGRMNARMIEAQKKNRFLERALQTRFEQWGFQVQSIDVARHSPVDGHDSKSEPAHSRRDGGGAEGSGEEQGPGPGPA